jgi:Protein tyrosine and serine/threonine kinase
MGEGQFEVRLVDLKEWSEVFDISWYLIIRLANMELDQQLQLIEVGENEALSTLKDLREAIKSSLTTQAEAEKVTVFLPSTFFTNIHYTPLEFGPSASGIWTDVDGSSRYLIDQPSSISTLPDVCKLAKILKEVKPFQFGILTCQGVVKEAKDPPIPQSTAESKENLSTLVFTSRYLFNIPSTLTKPQYLRTFFASNPSQTQTYPLDDRFSLARQLAKAVMFVHSAGFVHKNIRPETIILFEENDSTDLWAFLTGFESFRVADGHTMYHGDEKWEKNLYRHPTRQGVQPEEVYSMQHDIYSLGVCLLEIGMGTSLVLWNSEKGVAVANESITAEVNSPVKDRKKGVWDKESIGSAGTR